MDNILPCKKSHWKHYNTHTHCFVCDPSPSSQTSPACVVSRPKQYKDACPPEWVAASDSFIDQNQAQWLFCCLCQRRNIGFIKNFPQLKVELLRQEMADIWLGTVDLLFDLIVGTFWLLKGGLKVSIRAVVKYSWFFQWPSFKHGGAGDLSNRIFVSGHSQTW